MIIKASIWLKRLKITVGLLLPSWSVTVWSRHSVRFAAGAGRRERWLCPGVAEERSQKGSTSSAAGTGTCRCCRRTPLAKKCLSISYGSVQGNASKQADSYSFVVCGGRYVRSLWGGHCTETCSGVPELPSQSYHGGGNRRLNITDSFRVALINAVYRVRCNKWYKSQIQHFQRRYTT